MVPFGLALAPCGCRLPGATGQFPNAALHDLCDLIKAFYLQGVEYWEGSPEQLGDCHRDGKEILSTIARVDNG